MKKAMREETKKGDPLTTTAHTIAQPQTTPYDEGTSEEFSSNEEGRTPGQYKKRGKRGNASLPPRNAIKKLIGRELERQAPLIFNELVRCKELG